MSQSLFERLLVSWTNVKKLNKNKENDLDDSIEKIGIGVNHSHSSVFSMNRTYNISSLLTLMHI